MVRTVALGLPGRLKSPDALLTPKALGHGSQIGSQGNEAKQHGMMCRSISLGRRRKHFEPSIEQTSGQDPMLEGGSRIGIDMAAIVKDQLSTKVTKKLCFLQILRQR